MKIDGRAETIGTVSRVNTLTEPAKLTLKH